jgi:hypothetical protein
MTTDDQCPFCHGVHYSSYNAERCLARHEARKQARDDAKARSTSRQDWLSGGKVSGQGHKTRPQKPNVVENCLKLYAGYQ